MDPSPKAAFLCPADPQDLALCQRFGLAAVAEPQPGLWLLHRWKEQLRLTAPEDQGGDWLTVEAGSGPMHRRLQTARRSQPLPRAVGLHRRTRTVLDATAGLGRDALLLARLGAAVTAVERIPVLAALIAESARVLLADGHLEVVCGEATDYLDRLATADRPDVVYLDPMFRDAARAQVKKEMQICRRLAGPPGDPGELLRVARTAATDRVVVKRHPDHDALAEGVSFSVAGARVRFDVYLTEQSPRP